MKCAATLPEDEAADGGAPVKKPAVAATRTVVLEDGTYGTESVGPAESSLFSDEARETPLSTDFLFRVYGFPCKTSDFPLLTAVTFSEGCRVFREKLVEGDSLLAATLAVTVTKLLLLSSPVYVRARAKAWSAVEEDATSFEKNPQSLSEPSVGSSQVLSVSP